MADETRPRDTEAPARAFDGLLTSLSDTQSRLARLRGRMFFRTCALATAASGVALASALGLGSSPAGWRLPMALTLAFGTFAVRNVRRELPRSYDRGALFVLLFGIYAYSLTTNDGLAAISLLFTIVVIGYLLDDLRRARLLSLLGATMAGFAVLMHTVAPSHLMWVFFGGVFIAGGMDTLMRNLDELTGELAEVNAPLQRASLELTSDNEALTRATHEAHRASRAKSDFLANMSHEIRTPMNAVLGMTHLVLKTELSVRQRDYLQKIQLSSQQLLGIINDILDFSKIEAGQLTTESIEFELETVLDNIVALVSGTCATTNSSLAATISNRLLSGDAGAPSTASRRAMTPSMGARIASLAPTAPPLGSEPPSVNSAVRAAARSAWATSDSARASSSAFLLVAPCFSSSSCRSSLFCATAARARARRTSAAARPSSGASTHASTAPFCT